MDVKVPDIDLDLLRCFLAVADTGGFTAAAKRLNLSQSAVSLKIQRLENILGREVLARTSRSLTLTREGEIVLGYAHRLLGLSREMIELVAQPAVESFFRVGVSHQFGSRVLPALLAQFRRSHPQVSLTVEVGMTGDLLGGLEEDRFDVVVGAAGYTAKGHRADAFTEERLLVREPSVWVQSKSSRIPANGDPLPLVLFPPPCGIRKVVLESLEKAGRAWQVVFLSTSLASVQSAVEADLGISALGRSSVTPNMKIITARQGWPALPDIAVSIYRSKSANGSLVRSLSVLLAKATGKPRSR
jgi:DNA-binding transcriptional LysR family regulator